MESQAGAHAAHSSPTASSCDCEPSPPSLLDLPPDLLARHVLQPYLSRDDLAALRQTSRLGRQLANAAVRSCVLDAYDDNSTAHEQIPSFCNLQSLRIRCTPPAAAPAAAAAAADTSAAASTAQSTAASTARELAASSSSRLSDLQQQLPCLVSKLPCLSQLVYEGPRDRRQQGLDVTAALQTLAAAAAPGAAAAQAAASSVLSDSRPDPQQQQQQQQEGVRAAQATPATTPAAAVATLRVLDLRAGSLPDRLMEAVGQLTGLVSLRLTTTAALHMPPVAHLTGLTSVDVTVTPPLPAALSPLSRLTRLQALHLSALSPARGWGAALARLAPCPLESLALAFADVCDEDMQHVAGALRGLTRLNLNYSRHLTPAAMPHIAALKHLRALHLEETGLTLTASGMALLGSSTPHLHTLEASFSMPPNVALAAVVLPVLVELHSGALWTSGPGPDRRMMCRLQQQLLRFTSSVPAEAMQGDERSLGGLTLQDSSSSRSESGRQAMELEDVFAASGLQKGAPWPQLTRLLVSNATAEGFALLLLVCSNLRCLQVSSRGLASDTVLVACLEVAAPTQLQELSLPALSTSAGRVLSRTVSLTIPSLKQLSFTGPASLSMELLEAFRSAEVESLAFRRCDSIDNQLLCQGIGSISSLRQLELIGCDCVDGDALVSIAGQLPQLTRLVVLACARVGPDAGRAWECAAAAAARAAAGSGGVGGRRAPKQELLFADALAAVRE